MGYGNFKDLTRRTASDKILRDKVYNTAKIQNMMDIDPSYSSSCCNDLQRF